MLLVSAPQITVWYIFGEMPGSQYGMWPITDRRHYEEKVSFSELNNWKMKFLWRNSPEQTNILLNKQTILVRLSWPVLAGSASRHFCCMAPSHSKLLSQTFGEWPVLPVSSPWRTLEPSMGKLVGSTGHSHHRMFGLKFGMAGCHGPEMAGSSTRQMWPQKPH